MPTPLSLLCHCGHQDDRHSLVKAEADLVTHHVAFTVACQGRDLRAPFRVCGCGTFRSKDEPVLGPSA